MCYSQPCFHLSQCAVRELYGQHIGDVEALSTVVIIAFLQANSAAALVAAAEEGMRQGGFVYDERCQLYYDYSSGYYYDPVSRV